MNRVHFLFEDTCIYTDTILFGIEEYCVAVFFLWPRHLTNSSGGPVKAEASGGLIADMKEGSILFINVIIIFPMKNLDNTEKQNKVKK